VGHETDFTIADFTADIRASTPTHAAEIAVPSYDDLIYKLESIKGVILSKFKNNTSQKSYYINGMIQSIKKNSPQNRIIQYIQYMDSLQSKMNLITQNTISTFGNRFSVLVGKLDTLSPVKTLNRGYSITAKDKNIISSIKLLKEEDIIKVYMQDGSLDCKVLEISEGSLWKIEKKI
jgi:exodeoxyribonuclease VII large subunit